MSEGLGNVEYLPPAFPCPKHAEFGSVFAKIQHFKHLCYGGELRVTKLSEEFQSGRLSTHILELMPVISIIIFLKVETDSNKTSVVGEGKQVHEVMVQQSRREAK